MKTSTKTLSGALLASLILCVILFSFQSCKKNDASQSKTLRSNFTGYQGAFPAALLYPIPNTISTNLTAYWTFASTAYDLSGNLLSGVVHTVAHANDRLGHVNGAYSFNGTTSYVQVADTAALRLDSTDFTLNSWVYLTSYNSSNGSVILGKRIAGANNGYDWSISGLGAPTAGLLTFGPGGTGVNAIGTKVITLNAWHMVTSIYKLSTHTLSIYIDGVFDNATTGVLSPNGTISADLFIGEDNPGLGTSYSLTGSLSDIRIYSRAIDTAEIHHLYIVPTAPTSGIVAFWPLTRTATDISGNGHNSSAHANLNTATDRLTNSHGAYKFNGTSSYIEIPDASSLRLDSTDFTLNAWVNISAYNSGNGSVIISKRIAGSNNGYDWSISGLGAPTAGFLTFGPGGTGVNAIGTTVIGLNGWHMVTSVYKFSTKTLSIYIDGVFDNSTTGVLSPNALISADLYLGEDNPALGTGYFYNGALNDVRIYNRAVSTTEINQLLNALN